MITKEEKAMQKALGIDVYICTQCRDQGVYRSYAYNSIEDTLCRRCEAGWKLIWQEWLDFLNVNTLHVRLRRCTEHPKYDGLNRPEVLCDDCWKIWFEAPKKPEGLIDNV